MKLALLYNLKFTKVYINLEKYVIILTLCQICLIEFIRVKWVAKFMKHFKGGGGASYKSLSGLRP
jgi:hypothetical protein